MAQALRQVCAPGSSFQVVSSIQQLQAPLSRLPCSSGSLACHSSMLALAALRSPHLLHQQLRAALAPQGKFVKAAARGGRNVVAK